jgi:hypothetical protein
MPCSTSSLRKISVNGEKLELTQLSDLTDALDAALGC